MVLLLALAFGTKLALDLLPDALVLTAFQRVPAQLAAWYWGVPLEPSALVFETHGVTLEVTRACAATDFFAMVFALLVFSRFKWLSPVLAWLVTLGTNALRLVLLVPVDAAFPKDAVPAVHLGAGVAVFLPVLIAVWYLSQKLRCSDKEVEDGSRND